MTHHGIAQSVENRNPNSPETGPEPAVSCKNGYFRPAAPPPCSTASGFFTWGNCGWLLSLVKRGPSNLGLRVCRRRRAPMKQYVGLDVSMEETKVCVLDGAGVVVFEGSVASRPAALAKLLNAKAPHAERIALETGSLSSWLWHELKAAGFPVVCLDARHAKAALSMRINKTDRNDARGLAELIRMGWYREAKVKSIESRQIRALLAARSNLVDLRRDLENQMRGLLKSLGLIIGKSGVRVLPNRIAALLRDAPHLRSLIDPLMTAHSTLAEQIATYDLQVRELARTDQTIGRLMTVPGIGPVTALAFASTVDDPQRFARNRRRRLSRSHAPTISVSRTGSP